MNMAAGMHGIVLFAHGSRDPLWHRPIEAVAQRLAVLSPQTPVTCAYLELSTPPLGQAVAALVGQGIPAIAIVPLFLGVGKHAREDLPRMVDALRREHPEVQFSLQAAVGENPRLVQVMAEIALEGLLL